jgi:DHA2 family metal-tetracycline-proton antiporter-like MFS transporter
MTTSSTTSRRSASGPALLAALTSAMLATVIASDMVNLVLPSIGDEFGASEAELAWVVTGFLLVFSVGIPFYGRLSDRVSLRKLFSFALVTYAVGSLVCAVAPALWVLVAGRVVMGIGAAGIPVLAVLAVTRLLPEGRRGAGIGVISAATGIGTAAGPALGGGLGQLLGWQGLFWIMTAIAVVILPAAARVLPGETPSGGTGVDLTGGILLGLGAGLVLFGITQVQVAGLAAPVTWGSLAAGLASVVLFGWRNGRTPRPFVPTALFTGRVFPVMLVVAFLAMGVNLGGLVFVPILLVDINGLTPGAGALAMVPAGLAVALLSPLSGRVADRGGARPPVLAGLTAMGVSTLFLSTVAGNDQVVLTAVGIAGLSVGFIFVLTPIISAAAGALPAEQAGIGIGILQGAQFLGAGAGPAIFGVMVTARLQSDGGALNPLHHGQAGAAYSDTFAAMALVTAIALVIALRMRPATRFRTPVDPV